MLIGYYRQFFGEQRNFYGELKAKNCDVILADREDESFEWKNVLRMLEQKTEEENTLVIPSIKVLGYSIQSLSTAVTRLLRLPNEIIVLDREDGLDYLLFQEVSEISSSYLASSISKAQDKNRKKHRGWYTKPPFGYKVVDRQLVPNEDEWWMAREIIETYRSDRTFRGTIAKINAAYYANEIPFARQWSTTTLRTWLSYPSLRGHTKHKVKTGRESIHYNTHQPLLTPEEAADIDDLINASREKWNKNAKKADVDYPLKGIIFCGVCGSSCYRSTSSRDAMRCRKRDEDMSLCSNAKSTPNGMIEDAVIEAIRNKAPGFIDFYLEVSASSFSEENNEEIIKLKNQIAGLQLLITRYGDRENIMTNAIASLEFEIQNERQKAIVEASTQREIATYLSSVPVRNANFWRGLSNEERKTAFESLVEKVVIQDGGVSEVVLKF